jgi:hypothetical protein
MRNSLLFIALLIAPLTVFANRPLPEDGVRAKLSGNLGHPLVQLGGKVYRMSPGSIVRDESNRKILHGELPANADVLFLPDANGEIARIWILTPEEKTALSNLSRK